MSKHGGLLLSTSLMALAWCGAAHSQTTRSNTIEELVVTAEKREQNLQDVPVAISAYTSDTRDKLGIINIQDLTNFVPGLTYTATLDRALIRGVGRLTNVISSEPGVAVYNDGLFSSSTSGAAAPPLFVERVEVLRGPQGTLYGRNSVGGAINVVSKRPAKEFSGEIRATLANYDRKVIMGAVSVPVTDHLRFKFAGSKTNQDEGYFTNYNGGPDEGGKADEYYLQFQAEAELGENVEAWLKVDSSGYTQNRRTSTFLTVPYNTVGLLTSALAINPLYSGPGASPAYTAVNPGITDEWGFRTNTPFVAKLDDSYSIVAHLTYHLPGADLKYVGGYLNYLYASVSDYDGADRESWTFNSALLPAATRPTFCVTSTGVLGAPCPAITMQSALRSTYAEEKSWASHELTLTSTGDSALQWIGGLYYFAEEDDQPTSVDSPNQAELANPAQVTVLPAEGLANPYRDIFRTHRTSKAISRAAFGQIDWQATDQLKFTLGLRYTKDEKKGTELIRYVRFRPDIGFAIAQDVSPIASCVGITSVTCNATANKRFLSNSWSATTGTAGVQWEPSDDTMVYAKYSRGYKAGGFNLSATVTGDPDIKPEFVDSYEAGVKLNIGSSLQANIAAFYYDYRNSQTLLFQRNPVTNIIESLSVSLEAAVSQGVEIETIWRPIDPLTIFANYSYLDAHIDQHCCALDPLNIPAGLQQLAGNDLIDAPRHKVAVAATYQFDLEPGTLNLTLNYNWRDEIYAATFRNDLYKSPAFSELSGRAQFTDKDDRYSVIAYVRNLLNDDGYEYSFAASDVAGVPYQYHVLTAPRTFGVEFQYRF